MKTSSPARQVWAWALYDWANSAFMTTVVAAVFPPFFAATAENAGLTAQQATSAWGFFAAGAAAVVALIGPVAGAYRFVAGSQHSHPRDGRARRPNHTHRSVPVPSRKRDIGDIAAATRFLTVAH